MRRIAVLFVHGVEISDPDYAVTPTRLLREAFGRRVGEGGPDPADALCVHAAHLAPVLEDQQRAFFERECPGAGALFLEKLGRTVRRITSGEVTALAPMAAALLTRKDPAFPEVHWPTARWVLAHFMGDAIAYQVTPSSRELYDRLHRAYADALAVLARKAGGDAPLCVIAHSFGTIVSSDFFYDRETERRTGRVLPPFRARARTPLERGETLAWLWTMGSPMALWSLRYPSATLSAPIAVPAPELAGREELRGGWRNLVDDDDLAAWPLQPLGPEYARAVEDVRVRVSAPPVQWTPLVHPFYWSDRAVMRPIGERLADAWAALQPAPDRPVRPERGAARRGVEERGRRAPGRIHP
jgi:hypothetical protein